MLAVIAFIVGAAFGMLQFWLLTKFTLLMTGGSFSTKAAFIGVLQFFLPVIVLILWAFLIKEYLLIAGTGIVAALIVSAVVRFALSSRKTER